MKLAGGMVYKGTRCTNEMTDETESDKKNKE